MHDIILPIVKHIFFRNPHPTVLFGVTFDGEKIIDNIIYLTLILVIFYLFLKLVLGRFTGKIIQTREQETRKRRELTDKLGNYFDENIRLLKSIDGKLNGQNNNTPLQNTSQNPYLSRYTI